MMSDAIAARIRAHRGNIDRYCRLLATQLTEIEREYIYGRIIEERSELERLKAQAANLIGPSSRPEWVTDRA